MQINVSRYQNINGVTCYMNSILHILQQILPLMKYINENNYIEIVNNKNNSKKWIIIEFGNLFKLSLQNPNSTIIPNKFRKCIGLYDDRWLDNEQQDSVDFLEFLLSKIQEEVGISSHKIPRFDNYLTNPITSIKLVSAYKSYINFYSNEYSELKKLFTNFNKYNKICGCCNNKSIKYEPNNMLHLAIPSTNSDITLYDCFDYLTKLYKMGNDNLYDCEFCGNKTFCYDQTTLWLLPEILIISFKRFNNNMRKNNTNIIYPESNLNLNNYFDNDTPHNKNNTYDLFAVNMHYSAGSINSGHYVSVIKYNNKWLLFNDDNNIVEVKNPQFNEAYILFYKLNNNK